MLENDNRGVSDSGLRSAVTGGAQMDGFINLFKGLIVDTGIRGIFKEPAKDLSFSIFAKRLMSHAGAFV